MFSSPNFGGALALERKIMRVGEEYSWTGFGNGLGTWESKCGLIIKQPHPAQTIVVVSDLGEDSGTSITNCAAALATLIVRDFKLNPATITWIEHYPSHRQNDPSAEYTRVTFD